MDIAAFLGMLFQGVLSAEAPAAIGWVESKLPGAAAQFAKFVAGLPATQALLTKLEQEAAGEVSALVNKGLGAIEDLLKAHVHGQVGAFLTTEVDQLKSKVTFTVEEANQFAEIVATGKWGQIAPQIMKDLGLS